MTTPQDAITAAVMGGDPPPRLAAMATEILAENGGDALAARNEIIRRLQSDGALAREIATYVICAAVRRGIADAMLAPFNHLTNHGDEK